MNNIFHFRKIYTHQYSSLEFVVKQERECGWVKRERFWMSTHFPIEEKKNITFVFFSQKNEIKNGTHAHKSRWEMACGKRWKWEDNRDELTKLQECFFIAKYFDIQLNRECGVFSWNEGAPFYLIYFFKRKSHHLSWTVRYHLLFVVKMVKTPRWSSRSTRRITIFKRIYM